MPCLCDPVTLEEIAALVVFAGLLPVAIMTVVLSRRDRIAEAAQTDDATGYEAAWPRSVER